MHPLAEKIAALRRRLVLRERAAAACWIVATVSAAALLLGFVDYLVRFADPGLRLMATIALMGAVAWAVYRWWYLPSRHRLDRLAVTRRVEARFPQLRDSLASAIEFLQQSEEDRTAGSAQLRRLVIAEAETSTEGLPLEEVVDRRPLRQAATWLTAVGILLALCLAWDARAVGTAAIRLAAPFGSTEWPRRHYLTFREVPTRIAAGDTFEVELLNTAGELPEDVRIEYRTEAAGRRQVTSEPMTPVGSVMIARREDVRQPFAFRAVGGDDNTMRWHYVDVVEPPQLESLEITVHPPPYTGLPPTSAQRHLQVLAGSGIEVRGASNKPLRAARIVLNGDITIDGAIGPGSAGQPPSAFHVAPDNWIAERTGPYRLELVDAEGLTGVAASGNLRVQTDAPPTVAWQRPSEDLFVTRTAVLPIALAVRDDLAIQRVELVYERSDQSQAEREREPEMRIELYRRPQQPPAAESNTASMPADERLIEYGWALAPLQFVAGAELTIHAEATDYGGGVGRTVMPRRIAIITPDELDALFAERQAQIARQLERALAVQQSTRENVRHLEHLTPDIRHPTPDSIRHLLQAAELDQRRVGQMLADRTEGVPALVDALVAEIEMNRLGHTELAAMLERLSARLRRLASGPLRTAERELTSARKAIESHPDSRQPTADSQGAQSLAAAGLAQDKVLATLERLVEELADKADLGRLVRLLHELREDQLAHAESTRAEIGLETLPLRVSELSRAQRARLNNAAAGQTALAARFEKIEQGMDRLSVDLERDTKESAARVTEALALARRLAIGSNMQEAAREVSENRIGQALTRKSQVADDLQQVLDALRGARQPAPEQVAESLRAAEDRLAELRERLAELREQVARAERQPMTEEQLERLHQEQARLRNEIEQLAGQLERLEAADASHSTQSAANRLDNRDSQEPQRPSPSQQVRQAEEDLAAAARQLAAQRQQAEESLALEFVRRFQAELTEMVERQQRVLDQTVQLDGEREPGRPLDAAGVQAVAQLAAEERQLAQLAKEHSEVLYGLGAVRVSLEDAERRLAAAADMLDQHDTGQRAQQAERQALARLQAMMEAFAQTAAEARENEEGQPNDTDADAAEQPQRRPTFELLELKMLRMLQVDLNERTRVYQRQLAEFKESPNAVQQAELEREARELAAEQGRLAELVEHMLTRDNDNQ